MHCIAAASEPDETARRGLLDRVCKEGTEFSDGRSDEFGVKAQANEPETQVDAASYRLPLKLKPDAGVVVGVQLSPSDWLSSDWSA